LSTQQPPHPNFPRLTPGTFSVESQPDRRYNCIAFAAEDTTRWWWPSRGGGTYWPPGIPLTDRVDSFVTAFEGLGYEICLLERLESGYEKVALFGHQDTATHAAKQANDGRWLSKLGRGVDIKHHGLRDVEGPLYGQVVVLLRRRVRRQGGLVELVASTLESTRRSVEESIRSLLDAARKHSPFS
jgi:hypothetical protein